MDRKPLAANNHWILLFAVFLIISFLPEALIGLSNPEGLVYTGGLVNTDDLSVYFSAIRQGAEGAWLFTPQFSPEAIPAQFSYLPFLLTGKLKALLGGSTALWFQLLRAFSLICAGLTLKQLTKTIFANRPRVQQTAWLFLLFGSGLGWLVSAISGGISSLTPDLTTPEWNLLTAVYSSPHFVLGIAGQAWFFTAFLRGLDTPGIKTLLSGVLAAGLVAIAYPFSAVVIGLVLALYFLVDSARKKVFPLKQAGFALTQCLPLLASLGYYGVVLPQNSLWAETMLSNNQILPPSWLGLLLGTGIPLALALAGITRATKPIGTKRLILSFWLLANMAAPYLPFSFSGRFVLGIFIPLSLLAGAGLENLLELPRKAIFSRLSSSTLRRMVIWLCIPSAIIFVVWGLQSGLSKAPPYFYPENIADAAGFLGGQTSSGDIILADYTVGNYLPRESRARVFAGHLNLTVDLEDKLEALGTFWAPETGTAWREEFLKTWSISYVVSRQPLSDLDGDVGNIIYQEDGITIYHVKD